MTAPIIQCEGLTHVYKNGVTALSEASVAIEAGQVVGVVGQNGSGKTTLVKHLNGLLKPTAGSVLVNGVDTRSHTVQELSRHAGYAFQNPNHQLFAKSVADELAFGPTNLGLDAPTIKERVEEALTFFGLEHVRSQHPYRLSYPLRKLVGIASVFAMQPRVFVLDEPTTCQDHAGVRLIRQLIGRLQERGYTVVVVSHDMSLIAEACERVLVLCQSRIIADGTPRQIFADAGALERSRLQPPQITRLAESLGLTPASSPILTVPEAVPALAAALRGT